MGVATARAIPFQARGDSLRALTLCWVLGLLLLAMPVTGLASGNASTDRLLEERIQAFLEERTRSLGDDVTITLHHNSARLPACENPQPFLPNSGQRLYGRVSVGVRCGEQARVRYLQADVSVLTQQVVLARDIAANTRLSASDLTLEEARLERLPRNALRDIAAAVGLIAVRPLPMGTTLQEYHLRREALVKRGDSVTVLAQGQGFSVSREVKALDNGALGEEVRLRTHDGDQLQARVVGRNRLEIVF